MEKQFLCACGTGLKCEGICKEENLHRVGRTTSNCSAAYEKRIPPRKIIDKG